MALRVIVFSGEGSPQNRDAGSSHDPSPEGPSLVFDSPRLVLGRGEKCDLRLPDPTVSLTHASLRQRGSEYLIVDEGSTNGTALGAVRLAPQSPRVVRSGERVRLGRVWLELRHEPGMGTPQPVLAAQGLALALVTRGLGQQGEDARPRVRVVAGPDAGKELVLGEPRRYVIGRAKESDLALDDPGAARRHLSLGLKGSYALVQDLAGRSDALLAGAPLGPSDVPWKRELELRLGANELRFVYPAAEALAELERGPDELLRPEEVPPEPSVDEGQESPSPPLASEGASGVTDGASGAEPRRPPAPRSPAQSRALRPQHPPPEPEGARWTRLDLTILLVAAAVIAASLFGLYSLLKR